MNGARLGARLTQVAGKGAEKVSPKSMLAQFGCQTSGSSPKQSPVWGSLLPDSHSLQIERVPTSHRSRKSEDTNWFRRGVCRVCSPPPPQKEEEKSHWLKGQILKSYLTIIDYRKPSLIQPSAELRRPVRRQRSKC